MGVGFEFTGFAARSSRLFSVSWCFLILTVRRGRDRPTVENSLAFLPASTRLLWLFPHVSTPFFGRYVPRWPGLCCLP